MSISYRVLSIRAGSLSLVKCDLHVETCEQFSVKILAHATYALCDDPSSCHSHAPTRQENWVTSSGTKVFHNSSFYYLVDILAKKNEVETAEFKHL